MQIEKKLEIKEDVIEKHLRFLYSGLNDYDDGKIEISILNQAEHFSVQDITAAAQCAKNWNAQGKSVYVIGTLIDPDTAPFGRANDSDFYACNVIWCDIDENIDPDELKKLYAKLPPNVAVITARVPHRRTQLWWKLAEPLTDPETLREALIGVAQALRGDRAVTNPVRLMRLGGLINFPAEKKRAAGRVDEVTEFHELHNNTVDIERFLTVYKSGDYGHAQPQLHPMPIITGSNPFIEQLADGREKYMSDMLYAAIVNLTRELGRWPTPQEVFDDAWPVYSRKVSPRNGRTLEQDGRGQKLMQSKIRSKLSAFQRGKMRGLETIQAITNNAIIQKRIVKPDPKIDQVVAVEKKSISATSIKEIDLNNIPPREFLFGSLVGRKYVSMIVAPAGSGKSIFTMQLAMHAAAGKSWGDWHCKKPINVWIYNNEEGFDELRRRIRGILQHTNIEKESINNRLYIDSGENQSISIAKLSNDGEVIATPDYEALKNEVLDRKIDLLIIDPFAETHSVNENSNDEIKRVAAMFRQIAFDCDCAVLLVHHTRKGMDGAQGNQAGNADMARGGGATMGVVRRAYTMSNMSKDDADAVGLPQEKRKWFVRLDDAKSNITAPADKTDWFMFKQVAINNGRGLYPEGDIVGVLDHVTIEQIEDMAREQTDKDAKHIIEMIAQYMDFTDKESMSISDLARGLVDSKKTALKFGTLRKKIPDCVKSFGNNNFVIFNGFRCYMSITENRDEKNAAILKMKKVAI